MTVSNILLYWIFRPLRISIWMKQVGLLTLLCGVQYIYRLAKQRISKRHYKCCRWLDQQLSRGSCDVSIHARINPIMGVGVHWKRKWSKFHANCTKNFHWPLTLFPDTKPTQCKSYFVGQLHLPQVVFLCAEKSDQRSDSSENGVWESLAASEHYPASRAFLSGESFNMYEVVPVSIMWSSWLV